MKITTKKTRNEKPKKWSRKGNCPSCDVSGGSNHSKNCQLIYEKFIIKL